MNEMQLDGAHDVQAKGGKIQRTGTARESAGQSALCMLKTEQGSAFTDGTHGIPWLGEIAGLPVSHLDVARKIVRDKLEAVHGVKSVRRLSLVANGRNIGGEFSIETGEGKTTTGAF